jgi:hypothetical protein
MLAAAWLLIAAGGFLILFTRGRKVARAAIVLVILMLTSCTSASETPAPDKADVAGPTKVEKENVPEDRVLGLRIERDDNGVEETTDTLPTSDASAPVAFEMVEVTELVPAPDGETLDLESRMADNRMQLDYDLMNRAIVSALSSRLITADSTVDLLTSVTESEDGLTATVEVVNASDKDRLHVAGTLRLVVTQIGGGSSTFESQPLDETLEPGGTTVAEFSFLLPSGQFDVLGSFDSAGQP